MAPSGDPANTPFEVVEPLAEDVIKIVAVDLKCRGVVRLDVERSIMPILKFYSSVPGLISKHKVKNKQKDGDQRDGMVGISMHALAVLAKGAKSAAKKVHSTLAGSSHTPATSIASSPVKNSKERPHSLVGTDWEWPTETRFMRLNLSPSLPFAALRELHMIVCCLDYEPGGVPVPDSRLGHVALCLGDVFDACMSGGWYDAKVM